MTLTAAYPPIVDSASTDRRTELIMLDRYVAPMAITTNAAAIAVALRERVEARTAYLPDRKLHALLYLAQGICFAANDEPLFTDGIVATEHGVRLELAAADSEDLGDVQYAPVLTVAARYGGLSTMDLESLIRGQGPWSATETGQTISAELIRQTFRDQDDTPEGTLLGYPRSARSQLRRPDHMPNTNPQTPDSPEEIEAFVAAYRRGEDARL